MSMALAAGFAGSPALANTIVYFNTSSDSGNSTGAGGTVYFNPTTDSLSYSGFDFDMFQSMTLSFWGGNGSCSSFPHAPGCSFQGVTMGVSGTNRVAEGGGGVEGFNFGAPIAGTFGGGGAIESGQYEISAPGGYAYIGLLLGNDDYGWAEIHVIEPYDVELVGMAYDVVQGQTIDAGQTSNNQTLGGSGGAAPEPGTLVLLALGAAGVAALRRRRRIAAK